jgi:hypothetical protein
MARCASESACMRECTGTHARTHARARARSRLQDRGVAHVKLEALLLHEGARGLGLHLACANATREHVYVMLRVPARTRTQRHANTTHACTRARKHTRMYTCTHKHASTVRTHTTHARAHTSEAQSRHAPSHAFPCGAPCGVSGQSTHPVNRFSRFHVLWLHKIKHQGSQVKPHMRTHNARPASLACAEIDAH